MYLTICAIILHVFVGWAYFDLAAKHGKSKFLYAALSISSYYVAKFIVWAIIMYVFFSSNDFAHGEYHLSTMASWALFVPGLITCFGLFQILDYRWSRKAKVQNTNVLDDNYNLA